MDHVASRVGVLDRVAHCIRSVRMVRGVVVEEMGRDRDEVRSWFSNQPVDEDDSYIAFFYRCLEEGSEFYYLYHMDGSEPGWRCGGTTWDTPILGRLIPYEEAREAVEDWSEDLKWSATRGE